MDNEQIDFDAIFCETDNNQVRYKSHFCTYFNTLLQFAMPQKSEPSQT
jgi:hypothetical protein